MNAEIIGITETKQVKAFDSDGDDLHGVCIETQLAEDIARCIANDPNYEFIGDDDEWFEESWRVVYMLINNNIIRRDDFEFVDHRIVRK